MADPIFDPQAYGLTEARLYAVAVLLWLALVFAPVLVQPLQALSFVVSTQ